MTRRRFLAGSAAAGLASLAGCGLQTTGVAPSPTQTPAGPVELTEVTVTGLEAAIKEQKGKVVLIDVWFLGCDPCKKKFPHLVDLHNRYAKDGLACVSLDMMPSELPAKDKILAFLQSKGASFANFIFNDTQDAVDAWTTKYQVEYTPKVILFNRAGVRVRVPDDAEYEEIEETVKKLLAEK